MLTTAAFIIVALCIFAAWATCSFKILKDKEKSENNKKKIVDGSDLRCLGVHCGLKTTCKRYTDVKSDGVEVIRHCDDEMRNGYL